jgi:predicted double-glycine peptidase
MNSQRTSSPLTAPCCWAAALCLAMLLAASPATAESLRTTPVVVHVGDTRIVRPVVSFQELRQSVLVRQTWDSSCGAAALSTVLTHQFGLSISEYAVAAMILRESDPARVRARGGFSLLDLKRFVELVGLRGMGYGEMSFADLARTAEPAIVPIHSRGLDHFVVFRGVEGNRVVLGDPAYGNLTMTTVAFEDVWKSRIAFYVRADGEAHPQRSPLAATELDLFVPNLSYVSRLVRGGGPVPPMRQPPVVAR